jgi:hypothetical protein
MRFVRLPLLLPCFCVAAANLAVIACGSTSGKDSNSGFARREPNATTTRANGADAGNEGPIFGEIDGGGGAVSTSCAPSPANVEIPGNGCDDDGDGTVDNNAVGCDTSFLADGDATAFAKALGLCQTATGPSDTKWGVISATYSNRYNGTGAPNNGQHGILPKFGDVIKPREGASLGVLSTGFAREYDSLTDKGIPFKDPGLNAPLGMQPFASGGVPPSFPKAAAGCPVATDVHDTIVMKLEIKTPANAKGLSFDFNFWSGEWPEFVCSPYNDGFIAYLKSTAFNGGVAENMSFDAQKNPVSVNNGFFDRCTPNTATGCADAASARVAACAGGTAELKGTGFGGPEDAYCAGPPSSSGGATGWLTSTAPVAPGEVITLQFIIWDTGDAALDSSVLIDNFSWVPGEVSVVTQRPK